ncbi:MAG: LPXTG cell wall anchor domain-containing protein [Parafannyhessea sp.]
MNKKGSTLPSTGGMGTTILYVAGAAIVVAAGIGLAIRRNKRQNA